MTGVGFKVAAPGYKRFSLAAGQPLIDYLYAQQIAACSGLSPGVTTQRAYTDLGAANPSMFLKQPRAGFDIFDTDSILIGSGTCSANVYISAHHYLVPCGTDHDAGLVETDTMKLIGSFKMHYSVAPYTGTIAKFLPSNYAMYVGTSRLLPAFARLENTNIVGETQWVMPVNAFNLPTTNQFLPDHPLFAWQQQYAPYLMVAPGDSGSPVFCGIKGDLVLLSFVSSGSSMGVQSLANDYWLMAQKMVDLATYYSDTDATTYRPLTVDLSFLDR